MEHIDEEETSHWQPIYEVGDLRVSGIYSKYHVDHLDQIFLPARTNLMASSLDGLLIFLTVLDTIRVYKSCDFTGKTPPLPSTVFPYEPFRILRPTPDQILQVNRRRRLALLASEADEETGNEHINTFIPINHIRVGMISEQESLVAVGEYGLILVWDISNLSADPILLESDNTESTWGIAMSRGNHLLATSSNSRTVTIFHFPTRQVIFSQKSSLSNDNDSAQVVLHEHNIPSLDMSSCGRWMVSCGIDGLIIVWSFSPNSLSIRKYSRRISKEWGWLARFVPPRLLNYTNSTIKASKRFYQTDLENISEEIAQEDLFFSELFPNDNNYLERIEEFANMGREDGEEEEEEEYFESEEAEDVEEQEQEQVEQDQEQEQDHERVEYQNMNLNQIISRQFSFLNQTTTNIDGVHLAEGAGDTWETDTEDDRSDSDSETESDSYDYDYDSFDSQDQDSYSDSDIYNESDEAFYSDYYRDNSEYDYSSDYTTSTSTSTSTSTCTTTTTTTTATNSSKSTSSTDADIDTGDEVLSSSEFNNIPYKFAVNNDPHNNIFTSTSFTFKTDLNSCSFDIFYFTSESFYVISSADHRIMYKRENLTESLLSEQNSEYFSNVIPFDSRLKRLAMGEWIPELSLFIAIDNDGFIIFISPDPNPDPDSSSAELSFIILPDTLTPAIQSVLGYTLIRKLDSEFGIKLHLYLICHDGTFRLYEIIRKQ